MRPGRRPRRPRPRAQPTDLREPDPAEARRRLIETLVRRGAIRGDRTAEAMGRVPRESFLPVGADPAVAYENEPVILKRDGRSGRPISTISQPAMIATMLDQLEPQPGDRILEIGTASGYNAALLAELVGPAGRVVTVEIEPDLAASAAVTLRGLGLGNVWVICADGIAGWPGAAPYDGIIVTAGASRAEPAWVDQLREGGRLVVPIAPAGPGTCFAYEKRGSELRIIESVPCGFVPLRNSLA